MSANRYVQECHKDTKEYYIPQKYKEISTWIQGVTPLQGSAFHCDIKSNNSY
jgi:hypothetical protein